MAYGARLESVLGASPRGFESPILRRLSSRESQCFRRVCVCCAPSPSATPLFLVQWRVNGRAGSGGGCTIPWEGCSVSGTRFDRGVRRDAVARVAAGESASAVARDVGCRHETVTRLAERRGTPEHLRKDRSGRPRLVLGGRGAEMALWEDRSRRPVERALRLPRDSAVFASRPPGAGQNDPPRAPEFDSGTRAHLRQRRRALGCVPWRGGNSRGAPARGSSGRAMAAVQHSAHGLPPAGAVAAPLRPRTLRA